MIDSFNKRCLKLPCRTAASATDCPASIPRRHSSPSPPDWSCQLPTTKPTDLKIEYANATGGDDGICNTQSSRPQHPRLRPKLLTATRPSLSRATISDETGGVSDERVTDGRQRRDPDLWRFHSPVAKPKSSLDLTQASDRHTKVEDCGISEATRVLATDSMCATLLWRESRDDIDEIRAATKIAILPAVIYWFARILIP